MMRSYVEPTSIDKDEFAQIIASGNIKSKCNAIVRAVHSISDYDWLISEFSKLINNPNHEVRGVTVTCIGHIARLHCRHSNKQQLLQIIEPLLIDSEISGRVEDALDDINTFL
jgi:hypothetical protein